MYKGAVSSPNSLKRGDCNGTPKPLPLLMMSLSWPVVKDPFALRRLFSDIQEGRDVEASARNKCRYWFGDLGPSIHRSGLCGPLNACTWFSAQGRE